MNLYTKQKQTQRYRKQTYVAFFNDYKRILLTGYQEEIRIGEVNIYFLFVDGDFKVYFFALVKNPDTQCLISFQVPDPSPPGIQNSIAQRPLFPLKHTDRPDKKQ